MRSAAVFGGGSGGCSGAAGVVQLLKIRQLSGVGVRERVRSRREFWMIATGKSRQRWDAVRPRTASWAVVVVVAAVERR